MQAIFDFGTFSSPAGGKSFYSEVETLSKSACFNPPSFHICGKMPRFLKNCNNPFHDDWSKGVGNSRIFNLRAHGLSELTHSFAKFISHEGRTKSPKVNQICFNCLQQCLKKRSFTRHLAKQSNDAIKEKVG